MAGGVQRKRMERPRELGGGENDIREHLQTKPKNETSGGRRGYRKGGGDTKTYLYRRGGLHRNLGWGGFGGTRRSERIPGNSGLLATEGPRRSKNDRSKRTTQNSI